jgi:uncharacterized protein (DUF2141 family)
MRPASLSPSSLSFALALALATGATTMPLTAAHAADAVATTTGDLVVHVGPLHDTNGQVVVNLYDTAAGFPKTPLRQVRQPATQQAGGEATVVVPGVAGGQYAVLAFQDLKGDGHLARNFIGIPTEPYGFSGAPAHFGPPAFADASFRVPAGGAAVTIKLK